MTKTNTNTVHPLGDHSLASKAAKPARFENKKDGTPTKSDISRNQHINELFEGHKYFIYEEDSNTITEVTYLNSKLIDDLGNKYNFPDFITDSKDIAEEYKLAPFM